MTTYTWVGTGVGAWQTNADWDPAGVPGPSDTALITTPGSYTVTANVPGGIGAIAIDDGGATVSVVDLVLRGPLQFSAGTLALGGVLSGGTVAVNGGTVAFDGGTLAGVAWQGAMDLSAPGTVAVENGLTMTGAGGTGPGTIALAGNGATLTFAGSQTLSSAVIDAGDNADWSYMQAVTMAGSAAPVLTLGTDTTIEQTGSFFEIGPPGGFQNQTFGSPPVFVPSAGGDAVVNDGTIDAARAGGDLLVGAESLANAGRINVSNGDAVVLWAAQFSNAAGGSINVNGGTLAIQPSQFAFPSSVIPQGTIPLPTPGEVIFKTAPAWTNQGSITVGTAGVLGLSGGRNIGFVGDAGGTVTVAGSLNNAGGTIEVDAGSLAGDFSFGVPTIKGGVIASAGAGTITGGEILDAVALEGTLSFGSGIYQFHNGLTLSGLGGSGPAVLNDTTHNAVQFYLFGNTTIDNATINIPSQINILSKDSGQSSQSDAITTLGSNLTITGASLVLNAGTAASDADINDAIINLTSSFSVTISNSFTNTGTISTGTGLSAIDAASFLNTASGVIAVPANGNLFIGGGQTNPAWSNQGQITVGTSANVYFAARTITPDFLVGIVNNGGLLHVTDALALAGQSMTLAPQLITKGVRDVTIGATTTAVGVTFGFISDIIGTGTVFTGGTVFTNVPGTIEANGGTMVVAGSGTESNLVVDANSDLVLDVSNNIHLGAQFNGTTAVLTLLSPSSFTGTLSGLAPTDMIDIVNATVTGATLNGSTLTFTESNGSVLNYALAAPLTGDAVQIASDGAGGSDLMIEIAEPYSEFLNQADQLATDANNLATPKQVLADAVNVYTAALSGAIGTLDGKVPQQAFDGGRQAASLVSADVAGNAQTTKLLTDVLNLYGSVFSGVVGAVAQNVSQSALQTIVGALGTLAADIVAGAPASTLQTDLNNVFSAVAGSNIGSASWQQAITDADNLAATLANDQAAHAAAAVIQTDVANLYDTMTSDSLEATGGDTLKAAYTGGATIQTLAADIAGKAAPIVLAQDLGGAYLGVLGTVTASDTPLALQTFQTVIATNTILATDILAKAGPGQLWFDTAGLMAATESGQLAATDGPAAQQSFNDAISNLLQLQQAGASGTPPTATMLSLDTKAEADAIGFITGTLAQAAFTSASDAAETLAADVGGSAGQAQILSDTLAVFAQDIGEFAVFNGGASQAAYGTIVAAANTLDADIAAGNAAAISADVSALIAASQTGEVTATNAAAWQQLGTAVAQAVALLIADINTGASLNQRLKDGGTLYDALVKGSNAATGSRDPQLTTVNVLPSTLAQDVVNTDTVALEPDGLLLANELADPCGPLMEENLSPLDQVTNVGGRLDTIADLVGRIEKLFGASEGSVPGLLDTALTAMKSAVTQLQGEAALGQQLLGSGFFEADAAALAEAGIADAAAGAAVGGAYVGGLEALAPFLAAGAALDLALELSLRYAKDNPQWANFFNNIPLGRSLAWFHQFFGPFFNMFNVFNPGAILKAIANLIQPQWGPNELPQAQATGDVHLITFDGLHYDFQATGEFILAKSVLPGDSFQVQTRLEPWANSASVSKMTMIGAQLGTDRITFAINRPNVVWLNGNPVTLTNNTTLTLNGGTLTQLSGYSFQVNWQTGESITVTNEGTFLDLSTTLAPTEFSGGVQGLMGPNTGQLNDFSLPDGTVLTQPLTSAQLYGTFANAWRVAQANSLLDYGPGETTATFTDVNFPADAISLTNLPANLVNTAQNAVQAAGITDPTIAADAAFDYIATGDPGFIAGDAAAQQPFNVTGAAINGGTVAAAAGVMATVPTVIANASGTPDVTFEVYLTGTAASDTTIGYAVQAAGTGFFDATSFGGTLPSGTVTITAGQTTGQFTIALPAGALGSLPSDDLQVGITAAGGNPVFAATARSTVASSTPVAGTPAVPVLELPGNPSAPQRNGNAWTLNLGTLPVGDMPSISFAIANLATAPADALTGGFSVTAGSGVQFLGATTFPALAPGQVYAGLSAQIDSGSVGANSETLTFTPQEQNASGFSATLPNLTLTIQYDVALPGTATVNSPSIIDFGAVRSGTKQTQAVSVTNSAISGASPLDATATVAGAATVHGAITMLAAGATDNSSLVVGLDTSGGGKESGLAIINFAADSGNGNTEFMSSQAIEVIGSVYRPAAATIPAVIAHQGETGSRTLTISNGDPADGFSENLIASVTGSTGGVTTSGTTTGEIAPGASSTAIGVTFPTTSIGSVGTVTLDLVTDGTGIDGFGSSDLGPLALPVVVNNFAQAAIEHVSGAGTLTGSGNAYTLDLGSVQQNAAAPVAKIGVVNSATGPADLLSGSFSLPVTGAFTFNGFNGFSGLGAGQDETAQSITVATSSAGLFTQTVTLQPTGSNASGYSGTLAPVTLTVQADVLPCFLRGTRIATPGGLVAVERLRVGDRVETSRGVRPVIWTGEREIDLDRHASPERVLPVKIAAGAIAPNVPVRDLWLSPDHAIYIDGALIPVKHLINGRTIRQSHRHGRIHYHHIELDEHDIVLAEGLSAESYLDASDRVNFDDRALALHSGNVHTAWECRGYAPLLVTGPRLNAVRDWLSSRAVAMEADQG